MFNCILYAVGQERELQNLENYLDSKDNQLDMVCEGVINKLGKYENIYAYASAIKKSGLFVSRQINDFLMKSNRMIAEDDFLEAIAVSSPEKFSELTGMEREEVDVIAKSSFWTKLFEGD